MAANGALPFAGQGAPVSAVAAGGGVPGAGRGAPGVGIATVGAGTTGTLPDGVGILAAGGTDGAIGPGLLAGTGGGAASGSSGSGAFPGATRPCLKSGSEVVSIGDSYSSLAMVHRPLADLLAERAHQEGALPMADAYRDLAQGDATLATAPAKIQMQWAIARTTPPVKTVVMDGGGSDVSIANKQCLPDGSDMNKQCQMLVAGTLAAVKTLFTSMEKAGVSDVLYFWYPDLPDMAGGTGNGLNHYAWPMLVDAAKAASNDKFHVQMVDTVPIFQGHPEYIASDGVHPNDAGEAQIAQGVWTTMKQNCIAQAPSGGCCTP
jgi:lysophospholipase L1-like esterase